ncbi:2-isopropylmalate synthase [Thermoclostridium stercorarium]|uniref:alpha-isopropylmalate synthase regulatory domain-containing protein n=1 Tax=Thermoclostridium stercorarium TaxID=1510 RepID=UPI0022495E48|nr:alpha-isopropylmalate synthase regulatory domain-containing protein [Thermoclostridium stercorarium]UZQ84522.1 2-isopropylmalate synthase [Thermoclostridium stercorarium]
MKKIEIMDTTLRDGEQTPGVAFTSTEKYNIARILIEEVKVDRVEVASARVSKGEMEAVKLISNWGAQKGYLDRIEVLGFVDGTTSVDWICEAGAKVMNLLCKGSVRHVKYQLKKTPEEHIKDIQNVINYAHSKGLRVNVYLEVWSEGIVQSPEYVFQLIDSLKDYEIERFMLPDTLGILHPEQTYQLVKLMVDRYPDLRFDFHAHNDYDLAVANTFMAVKAGAVGVHTTVNGLGERTGNAPLSSVVGVLNDFCKGIELNVDEKKLGKISKIVEAFSGIRIPANKPIVGENCFTQTSGVHADGDNKANLYCNNLIPERFGRQRKYALGKSSGKASIQKNLEELGIELDSEAIRKITDRIVELGDKKENITTDDLPYIISDVLRNKHNDEKIKLLNYYICHARNLKPVSTVSLQINGEVYEETSTGDGQYDAFVKAVTKIYEKINKPMPQLVDYIVTIPPGGKTNALVETSITWYLGREFKTRGLDSDQTASAIKATMKALNIIEEMNFGTNSNSD